MPASRRHRRRGPDLGRDAESPDAALPGGEAALWQPIVERRSCLSSTSVAGVVFSTIAGGGWHAGTVAVAIALPAWWIAGVGLLRGSRRAHRLGLGLLAGLFAFDLLKILYYHESAGYLFCALTIVGLALLQAAPTRRWAVR